MTTPALDALRFPLHGSRLIEASAGTGKTFTIATLYVRLVLGHGGEAAGPLVPPEILVMTFTDAATQELRERIRARLALAAALFRAGPDEMVSDLSPGDPLHALRADHAPEDWPRCARQLDVAAEWMDEAAVSTIHGWCQRMLREHAFDSGSLFTLELAPDQSALRVEVVRDYWRVFFQPLDEPAVRTVQNWWGTPDALLGDLDRLFEHAADLPAGQLPGDAAACVLSALAALKQPWPGWCDELQALLDQGRDNKQLSGTHLKRPDYTAWLDALRDWAGDPHAVLPVLARTSAAWHRLTPAGIAEATRPGAAVPAHAAFEAMAGLRDAAQACAGDARTQVLCHAAHWVVARLAKEQHQRAQMGFHDLLTGLDDALRGPQGPRLAEAIRARFPVALVDEFQDTDPLQYRILDAVYRVADTPRTLALILIGDPKQAIYAFRGADIHTYLRARRDTAGRHTTLGTNYRSTPAMVQAVNHVFLRPESRAEGRGAFLFRSREDNPLPFQPVAAQGRRERFVVEEEIPAALQAWVLAEDPRAPASEAEMRRRIAQACADEIARLLGLGRRARAGFTRDGEALRALQPGDIAILVNKGAEASQVRQALRRRGVRSVYLSEGESVYQSAQALELQRWLCACAEPEDERLLRAALATPALGLDWQALDQMLHDEAAWEAQVLRFRAYRQCWRQQGVLPMLRRLLADFAVAQRLLAGNERALTDILHLAELLQQASTRIDGEHALIRHLAQAREQGSDDDARKLRLESDAGLVQVVTVHKSKGLEYPLVFLPYAGFARRMGPKDLPLRWHEADGSARIALAADDAVVARADDERLGEDLRRFYVALTRSRHATWLALAPAKDFAHSALGYLVQADVPAQQGLLEQVRAAWGDAGDACIAVQPLPWPPVAAEDLVPDGLSLALAPAREPRRGPHAPWWVASFSGLRMAEEADPTRDGDLPPLAPTAREAGSAAEDIYAQSAEADDDAPTLVAADDPQEGLHGFPRGPGPGTFLHGLLEWAAQQGFARVLAQPEQTREAIARRCEARGWHRWSDTLARWLPRWLRTELAMPGAGPLRLADLKRSQIEMEFWFGIHDADLQALDRLVSAHTAQARPRPALEAGRLNGMLKGFIDLAFEHEGRWYVADYKSNWLGEGDAAYSTAAMQDAVLAHRYDLQATLYVFALHRLLRARLADYDYERHVGGAVLLFLRGVDAPGHGVYAESPPRVLMDALDDLFASAREEA